MTAFIVILCILTWWTIGTAALIHDWRRSSDVKRSDFLLFVILGLSMGLFALVVLWIGTDGDKVFFKRREPKD